MNIQMSDFANTILLQKYSQTIGNKKETWAEIANRVGTTVLNSTNSPKTLIEETVRYIRERKFIPGGRYLYATGRDYHQVNNCLLLKAEDSREGWADLMYKITMALMSGAGIGIDYSSIRPKGALIGRTGGKCTGPLALMQMVNEAGRGIKQGGDRRSAIWAGLNWAHQDIFDFIRMKDWIQEVRSIKEWDFSFPATMDITNISVQLDDEFFNAYNNSNHPMHTHAQQVYWNTIKRMLKTSEPGFTVDLGVNVNETLRNACCEITSADDSDVCNLGSINLARIESIDEMNAVVECATAFLLAGTVYSHVPYAKVADVRAKNRRLGLGLMGIHEWLLVHGYKYEGCSELDKYLTTYADDSAAKHYSNKWSLSAPIKTRAIAPTGSIGIIGETTTGIEPIFCSAFKRRYLNGQDWHYQYVIDPTAKKLVESGVNPDDIEDAYTLSNNVEKRIAFQAHVQKYVDHSISSTINLPKWGSELNDEDTVLSFGNTLMKYLPSLRGITVYPDGARSGQPLTPVAFNDAASQVGQVFIETPDICELSRGGTCGA
jgi:ribonucleoside-diphosphate reductase alpha chain